jgi:peptide chain release factor subunit 1
MTSETRRRAATRRPTQQTLRALSGAADGSGPVLSLYLDLDPSRFPNARTRQELVDAVIDDAGRRYADLPPAGTEPRHVEAALSRGRDECRDLDPAGARSVALYATAGQVLHALRLDEPVESVALLGRRPALLPLLPAVNLLDSWAVLLASRRTARILTAYGDPLEEVFAEADQVQGRHEQGGRSQSRYQRGFEQETEDHLEVAAGHLFEILKERPFTALILGAPEETLPKLRAQLHPYLRERVAGQISVDVEHTSVSDIEIAALAVLGGAEARRESALLDQLQAGAGQGEGGAVGVAPVLDSLNRGRVETLLVAPGMSMSGTRCPSCGVISEGIASCPADGTPMVRVENILEEAVATALNQSAVALAARYEIERMESFGGVGAILRY